jgi:hypothetical protein
LGWSAALDLLTTESVERYFAADAGQRQPGWFFLGVATIGVGYIGDARNLHCGHG